MQAVSLLIRLLFARIGRRVCGALVQGRSGRGRRQVLLQMMMLMMRLGLLQKLLLMVMRSREWDDYDWGRRRGCSAGEVRVAALYLAPGSRSWARGCMSVTHS